METSVQYISVVLFFSGVFPKYEISVLSMCIFERGISEKDLDNCYSFINSIPGVLGLSQYDVILRGY